MNGIFQWFKSSTKMKRWMFLILIGIILTCYGIAEILVLKEVSFIQVGKIITIFVAGFMCIVIGLIFLNKRTLEVLIESTDERMENRNKVNVNSLIFNKTIYDQGPNVVVIGGGTGLDTVLSGMKNYTSNITAIVTVSDYGKLQTESRKDLHILPTEDIKNSIISLSSNQQEMSNLFNYQYNSGKLKGLTFADVYFSTMQNITGEFTESVKRTNEVVNMVGKVLPVTMDEMKICAELANGYVVEEKDRIAEVVYDKVTKISRVYLNPSNCRPAPGVLEAIRDADSIIIGPGSLYTNVIPNLLVSGVAKAIKESSAMKIFISNIMTVPGQTDEYSISDHINAIVEHCGEGMIDYCIYDTGEVVPEFIKKYNREGADLVEQDIDVAKSKFRGIKFLQRNLSVITDEYVRHDANLVASSVIELICDDLRYQDKENDPQYLMMNSKLKADKQINKKKKAEAKARKKGVDRSKSTIKGKSKFSNKYSERIASIRESSQNSDKRKKQAVRPKTTRKTRTTQNKKIDIDPPKKAAKKETKEKTTRTTRTTRKTNTRTRQKTGTHTAKRMKTKADLKAEMEETLKNSKLGR
ncbi:MAG: YvcK family protein [Clostridia bacterium]|nr:YvcK family protein [Clostridia bacterium]